MCSPYYFGGWEYLGNNSAGVLNETAEAALGPFVQWALAHDVAYSWLGNLTEFFVGLEEWAKTALDFNTTDGSFNTTDGSLPMINGTMVNGTGDVLEWYLTQYGGLAEEYRAEVLDLIMMVMASSAGTLEGLVDLLEYLNKASASWVPGYYRYAACCPADAGDTCEEWEMQPFDYCFEVRAVGGVQRGESGRAGVSTS
jgi:hypothetical protein